MRVNRTAAGAPTGSAAAPLAGARAGGASGGAGAGAVAGGGGAPVAADAREAMTAQITALKKDQKNVQVRGAPRAAHVPAYHGRRNGVTTSPPQDTWRRVRREIDEMTAHVSFEFEGLTR